MSSNSSSPVKNFTINNDLDTSVLKNHNHTCKYLHSICVHVIHVCKVPIYDLTRETLDLDVDIDDIANKPRYPYYSLSDDAYVLLGYYLTKHASSVPKKDGDGTEIIKNGKKVWEETVKYYTNIAWVGILAHPKYQN